MVSAKYATHDLVDFVAGFSASDCYPISPGGALKEMIHGLQYEESGWFLGQLSTPVPDHTETRAIPLREREGIGKCYLTAEGEFMLQSGESLSQISSQRVADIFGAVEIAQALADRILERLDQYLLIGDIWETTLVKVKEKLNERS